MLDPTVNKMINYLFRAGVTFLGAPKFDISNSAVLIIFAQTVTWIGHYFSPLLPVVFAIVLFITFYVKKVKNSFHHLQSSECVCDLGDVIDFS